MCQNCEDDARTVLVAMMEAARDNPNCPPKARHLAESCLLMMDTTLGPNEAYATIATLGDSDRRTSTLFALGDMERLGELGQRAMLMAKRDARDPDVRMSVVSTETGAAIEVPLGTEPDSPIVQDAVAKLAPWRN